MFTKKRAVTKKRTMRGFSILEILIAVIIIGVLSLIVVPSLSDHVKEGRIAAARSDVNQLREAEERIALDIGYYVPFHVLDDTISVDPNSDSILTEQDNLLVQGGREKEIFIDPRSGWFLDDTMAENIYDRMTGNMNPGTGDDEELYRIATRFGFRGPYLSWQRDEDENDMQEDPWGNPYLFFTKRGLVWDYNDPDPATGRIQHQIIENRWNFVTFQQGGGADQSAAVDVFDRFAILSMGPNGVPGSSDTTHPDYLIFGRDDDIVTTFD